MTKNWNIICGPESGGEPGEHLFLPAHCLPCAMEELVRALCRGDLHKVENQLSIYPFLLDEVDEVLYAYLLSFLYLNQLFDRTIAPPSSMLSSTIITNVLSCW